MLARTSAPWLPALLLITTLLLTGLARADDAALCRAAVGRAETSLHLPDAFLSAIARVESGRPDRTGTVAAWPWTINAEGRGAFFDTEAEAVAAVRALQARGVRSIDVGCMQVNLMYHPEAFTTVEQAFDPLTNALFAGKLLGSLFVQTGSWPRAAAAYHSQTPTIGADYQRRVLAEWAVPDRPATHPPAEPGPGPDIRPPAPVTLAPASIGLAASAPRASFGRTSGFVDRPAGAAGPAFTGRSLAAYRSMPTALALRPPPRPG